MSNTTSNTAVLIQPGAPMPLSNGIWKKALATFVFAVSGYLLGSLIDPVVTPWTWPWLKHTLIVSACIGGIAELRFINDWAAYVLKSTEVKDK
jgi:hypothetical protein